jgi:hypothetical protein
LDDHTAFSSLCVCEASAVVAAAQENCRYSLTSLPCVKRKIPFSLEQRETHNIHILK